MSARTKQNFVHGSIILIAGAILVKVIGALFKIPLDHLIGSTGMGYFGSAYNLFVPIQTIAVAGFPVAISRMVAENVARGRFRDVRRIQKVAARVLIITGLLGSHTEYIPTIIDDDQKEWPSPATPKGTGAQRC